MNQKRLGTTALENKIHTYITIVVFNNLSVSIVTKKYVGQTRRNFTQRYKEHIKDNRNKITSGYSQHILETGHCYGKIQDTMDIL
jgi:predicted GIY-YIG superfamily endonuclease